MGHLFAFLAGAGVATWYLRHHTTYHAPPPGAGPHHPPATAPAYASQAERNKEWEEHCARLRDMGAQAGSTMMNVTEATLDVMHVAVQTLREKLAEQRTMRMEHQHQHQHQHRQVLPPHDQTSRPSDA